MKIPSPRRKPWWQSNLSIELFSFIGTVVPISWGLYQILSMPSLPSGSAAPAAASAAPSTAISLVIIGLLWAMSFGALKLLQARAKDESIAREENPQDLLGCTHVLYSLLNAEFLPDGLKQNDVRITIHKVLKNDKTGEEWFEQVIHYVGGNPGTLGRKFSIALGIVGLTIRTNSTNFFEREEDNYEQYRMELKKKFGFNEAQSKTVTSDRFSFLAVPICDKSDNKVIGAVYLDSSKKGLFSQVEIQEIVLVACTGIAKFLEERYK